MSSSSEIQRERLAVQQRPAAFVFWFPGGTLDAAISFDGTRGGRGNSSCGGRCYAPCRTVSGAAILSPSRQEVHS